MPESSDIPELSLEKDIATPQTESIDVIKGNLLAEASSEREVAEREVIRDERGNVQDIAFKLNGKCLRGLPPEQSKMELKEMILKQFPYGEDLQEKLVDRVHAELIQVAKMGEEEKAKIVSEADNTFFKTRANLSLETERPAWAIALKGIREMRANGINLYAGLNTEMFEEIDDALDTYQESDGKYLDEGNYFVRSRRPKTE